MSILLGAAQISINPGGNNGTVFLTVAGNYVINTVIFSNGPRVSGLTTYPTIQAVIADISHGNVAPGAIFCKAVADYSSVNGNTVPIAGVSYHFTDLMVPRGERIIFNLNTALVVAGGTVAACEAYVFGSPLS